MLVHNKYVFISEDIYFYFYLTYFNFQVVSRLNIEEKKTYYVNNLSFLKTDDELQVFQLDQKSEKRVLTAWLIQRA